MKNKKFKCALCGKDKSKKEKHKIYDNNVCNNCFKKLTKKNNSKILEPQNKNFIKNFLSRLIQ
jgi:ribosomal protein L37AE/L43A